ncbi:MAG: DUF5104 domain-containing protein [Clostridia bacterium]|nr:DUF5104 domain-containing protein [Clostridia bacterium]
MKHKKAAVIITSIALLTTSFSGCTFFDKMLEDATEKADASMKYYSKDDQLERAQEMKEDIIKCLKKEDKDGLKALFSEKALDRIDDIDEELDYVFENYEIDGAKDDDVSCSDKGDTGDYPWHMFSCSCELEASGKTIYLSWLDVPQYEKDTSYEGLFSLYFSEKDYTDMVHLAGVYMPEFDSVYEKVDFVTAKSVSLDDMEDHIEDNFTEECFEDLDKDELKALKKMLNAHPQQYFRWTTEKDGVRYLFIEMYSNNKEFALCLGVDEDSDLICHVSFVKYDKGYVPSNKEIIKGGLDDLVGNF